MARIFVSYRRADSITITGRIHDRLVTEYGDATVFKDVDDIPLGIDFRKVLEDEVHACDVQLVIIGPSWLTATDDQGERRLDNPDDFVRIEIEAGLRREKLAVIPVLVQGVSMPNSFNLPPSMRDLAYRNAAIVRDDPDFHRDMTRLIRQIETYVHAGPDAGVVSAQPISAPPPVVEQTPSSKPEPQSRPAQKRPEKTTSGRRGSLPWRWLAAVVAVMAVVAVGVLVLPDLLDTSPKLQTVTRDNVIDLEIQHEFAVGDFGSVGQAAWSPNGEQLAVPAGNEIALFDSELDDPDWLTEDHDGGIKTVAFNRDGNWLVSGGSPEDSALRLWDIDHSAIIEHFEGLNNVRQVGISADDAFVAGIDHEEHVLVWSTETGEIIDPPYETNGVTAMAFGPHDAMLALALNDTDVWVWDINQGEKVAYLSEHDEPVISLAFGPDGGRLATGSIDSSVKLWNLENSDLIFAFNYQIGPVHSVAFSPDGQLIAAGGEDHTVWLWSLDTFEAVGSLDHADMVNAIAFSPNGTMMAVACQDLGIYLWDVETQELLDVLDGHMTAPRYVAFSPDGTSILSGSETDTLVWGVYQ